MTNAFAEAAAQEGTVSIGIFTIVFLVIGFYFILQGLRSIITRQPFGAGKSVAGCTEASKRAYAIPYGLANILCGAGIVAFQIMTFYGLTTAAYIVSLSLIVLSCIVLFRARRKLQV